MIFVATIQKNRDTLFLTLPKVLWTGLGWQHGDTLILQPIEGDRVILIGEKNLQKVLQDLKFPRHESDQSPAGQYLPSAPSKH